jgi:hypothetical protein
MSSRQASAQLKLVLGRAIVDAITKLHVEKVPALRILDAPAGASG